MDTEKLLNKRRKLRNKIEDTKELITWTNNLFKKFNLLTIAIFIVTTILTIPLGLFFTNLFPVSIAINHLLPLGTFGFMCTMTAGGILVLNNIVLISSKLILKLANENLVKKLNETSALISQNYRTKNNIETKKQIQVKQQNKPKEINNNPYKYNYNPNKSNYLGSGNNNNQSKVKIKTKTK